MNPTKTVLPSKRINKMGTKRNPTYYVVIPKPLVDGQVLDLEKYYDFEVRESEVITEGVKEAKNRIKKEKRGR